MDTLSAIENALRPTVDRFAALVEEFALTSAFRRFQSPITRPRRRTKMRPDGTVTTRILYGRPRPRLALQPALTAEIGDEATAERLAGVVVRTLEGE